MISYTYLILVSTLWIHPSLDIYIYAQRDRTYKLMTPNEEHRDIYIRMEQLMNFMTGTLRIPEDSTNRDLYHVYRDTPRGRVCPCIYNIYRRGRLQRPMRECNGAVHHFARQTDMMMMMMMRGWEEGG